MSIAVLLVDLFWNYRFDSHIAFPWDIGKKLNRARSPSHSVRHNRPLRTNPTCCACCSSCRGTRAAGRGSGRAASRGSGRAAGRGSGRAASRGSGRAASCSSTGRSTRGTRRWCSTRRSTRGARRWAATSTCSRCSGRWRSCCRRGDRWCCGCCCFRSSSWGRGCRCHRGNTCCRCCRWNMHSSCIHGYFSSLVFRRLCFWFSQSDVLIIILDQSVFSRYLKVCRSSLCMRLFQYSFVFGDGCAILFRRFHRQQSTFFCSGILNNKFDPSVSFSPFFYATLVLARGHVGMITWLFIRLLLYQSLRNRRRTRQHLRIVFIVQDTYPKSLTL